MKNNRIKRGNKNLHHVSSPAPVRPCRASRARRSEGAAGRALHDVILIADPLAVRDLHHRSIEMHRLIISAGPEADCATVHAAVSSAQLLKLALWAGSMEPLVTVRSPAVLRRLVTQLAQPAASTITLSA